ncbi:DUF1353 domain-containing protein [Pseudaestuariivita atlantica]|uniref:DUF1353 domain-containing protein n=1 Tax=Pseudaestuariivita atlantica TaxID=1317121 RepID=UPI00067BCD89|nr:DUF1353 domain-containing protein [Pseudaestuariivita atlantica]
MTKRVWPIAALIALSGCGPAYFATQEQLRDAEIALAASFCRGSSAPSCKFVNTPVQTTGKAVRIPGRAAKFYRTANGLSFTDGRNATWVAPRDTLTDGASIPLLFVPIVGSPTDPSVVNAAAVHDAYCGIGNEEGSEYHARTWENTHRMFYDALRVGGTRELKAKIMFAAVYLGGPRWDAPARDLSKAPPERLQGLMRQTRSFIRASNPSIPEIEEYIRVREKWLLLDTQREERGFKDLERRIGEIHTEEEYDPYEGDTGGNVDLGVGTGSGCAEDPALCGE